MGSRSFEPLSLKTCNILVQMNIKPGWKLLAGDIEAKQESE